MIFDQFFGHLKLSRYLVMILSFSPRFLYFLTHLNVFLSICNVINSFGVGSVNTYSLANPVIGGSRFTPEPNLVILNSVFHLELIINCQSFEFLK